MFISMDRANLVFLHKHPERRVVTQLVTLEAPHLHTFVFPVSAAKDFEEFTDWELRKLYENTTGGKAVGFYRPGLEMLCFTAAQAVPESDVLVWELDLQVRTVSENDPTRYAYQRGAVKPGAVADLFGLPPLLAKPDLSVEATARSLVKIQPVSAVDNHTQAAGFAPTARDRAPAAPRVQAVLPSGATPRGGNREKIWSCADRIWEDAGKPVSVSRVLDLRKTMMDMLEKDGIKRTSASSELGNWWKSRGQAS